MKNIKYFLVFLMLQNVCIGQNVLISSQNFPNETSIMMDPKHPNIIIAAANLDNYYISSDTGHTWSQNTQFSSYGVWGDPAIAVDTNSNFYFFHLANPPDGNWIDRIVCQKTLDNGNTWPQESFTGLNGEKVQDKQWCAIDRTNNNLYITWTQFDAYDSSNPLDSSNILFSKSTDGGINWSSPERINKLAGDCIDSDNTVEGAVPAVGPNGEIYVGWAGPNGLVFNKSIDQGETWLANEIAVAEIPGGWDFAVEGIYRCNGLPITTCDVSGGTNNGTIYINWSDQRNGEFNTDVWLVKSIDGGNTWSAPMLVNNDASDTHQFFTWMAIDQTNGNLYFVFYDRRNYSNESTDVYLALSSDGGNTFVNRIISESPFTPYEDIFFGDYTNITAHNGIVRPIWSRLNNGNLSVWTDLSSFEDFATNTTQINKDVLSFEMFPNPSENIAYLSYKLHKKSIVALSIFDNSGKEIYKIINAQIKNVGKYVEQINLSDLGIEAGNYFLNLEIDGGIKTSKLIVLK